MFCNHLAEKETAGCFILQVLSGHSKIDKIKILMTNSSLKKVESIAECSPLEHSAILLTCIKRYSVLKINFGLLFEWPLQTGFTVVVFLLSFCC